MASNCQAAPLVASPSYPNSIAWSKENLVAIASGHLITILVSKYMMDVVSIIIEDLIFLLLKKYSLSKCYLSNYCLVRVFFFLQNPALLAGPRGLIRLPLNKPFPVGVVRREGRFCDFSFWFVDMHMLGQ